MLSCAAESPTKAAVIRQTIAAVQHITFGDSFNAMLGFFTFGLLPPIKRVLIARDFTYQGAIESGACYNRKRLQLSVSAN
jgi:hypothetical protein